MKYEIKIKNNLLKSKYKILFFLLLLTVFLQVLNNFLKKKKKKIIQDKHSKSKLPHILFKTGPFNYNDLPTEIKKSIYLSSKLLNCKFLYFNNQQCRNFIKYNFSKRILEAYDLLIPKAFKSDLWRYCVLYHYGGIYGDLTQTVLQKIDNDIFQYDLVLVKDRANCNLDTNIQISFMASKPKLNFLKFIINQITLKILRRDKGQCRFDLTGPVAFGKLFCFFFKVSKLYFGKNIYIGLDKKKYLINIPFQEIGSFISSIKDRDNFIIKTKTSNHFKLLYKNHKHHYRYQWKKDLVFKQL